MRLMPGDVYGENDYDDSIYSSSPFKLLSMAMEFEKAGVVSYAVDLYMKLLDKYPETFEAAASRLALFLIAGRYEQEGKTESAISIIREIKRQESIS